MSPLWLGWMIQAMYGVGESFVVGMDGSGYICIM